MLYKTSLFFFPVVRDGSPAYQFKKYFVEKKIKVEDLIAVEDEMDCIC